MPSKPSDYYVYAWYKDNEVLPFYIGRGMGNRAWETHKTNGGRSFCEKIRKSVKDFKVSIIRDRLTKNGAILCEQVLTKLIQDSGAFLLTNQTFDNGSAKQQPMEPLEILAEADDKPAYETSG
jgi:hypothetical protein